MNRFLWILCVLLFSCAFIPSDNFFIEFQKINKKDLTDIANLLKKEENQIIIKPCKSNCDKKYVTILSFMERNNIKEISFLKKKQNFFYIWLVFFDKSDNKILKQKGLVFTNTRPENLEDSLDDIKVSNSLKFRFIEENWYIFLLAN